MAPVELAFTQVWPQARRMNVLDDSLSKDLALAGQLDDAMITRFHDMADYVKSCGADAILFTCSAFGPAIESVKRSIGLPVLNPNEAMFDEALSLCRNVQGQAQEPARIGLLTTFAPSAAPLIQELQATATQRAVAVDIESACANGAMEALNAGEAFTHDQLILNQVPRLAHCQVLMLGQFSMARAQAAVAHASGLPVLTSPVSAVQRLRTLLG